MAVSFCHAQCTSASLRGAERRSNPALVMPCYGLLRGACHRARIRATRWLAMTVGAPLPRALIARLAHRDIALLLPRPVAPAGHPAIAHHVLPILKTQLLAANQHPT